MEAKVTRIAERDQNQMRVDVQERLLWLNVKPTQPVARIHRLVDVGDVARQREQTATQVVPDR
jgi:hypothetical protein